MNYVIRNRYSKKVLRLTLLDPITLDKYDLYYKLFDTPLAEKWAAEFINLRRGNYSFREKKINFKKISNKQPVIDKFNSLVDIINSFYDIKLVHCTDITDEFLNYFHDAYAVYGKRLDKKLKVKYWDTAYLKIPEDDPKANIWPGRTFNEKMHQAFIELNDMIHKTELGFRNSDDSGGFIALASFDPRTDKLIEEEDLPSMKFNLDFGDLCLGYNTLGKNLRHIVLDGDRESLKQGLVTPQTTWSNEIMCFMKPSDNHPWFQHDYYQKWKNISPEDFGFNYGDFLKNREGYFCIGELVPQQKEKIWCFVDQQFKIDLGRFEEIFDYEIISDLQAHREYTDPTTRIWKPSIPTNGKKIVRVNNPHYSVVTWIMNDICNYSCRYCPPFLHNGKNYKQQENWENISGFIQNTIDIMGADDRKVIFSISGGEPTLSPFFPKLIRKISDSGNFSRVTTNLSRTPRYIEENFKYLLGASCSFHPAMEFPNGTDTEFLKKLEIANSQTWAAVRVMMDPLYWDQTIEFIERVKEETTVYVEVVMIESQYGAGSNVPKYADIDYTDNQIDFINNFKIINNRGNYDRKSYSDLGIKNPEFIFEDGSVEIEGVNFQELINKGQTNFYGYTCNIGKESMFIHQTGEIRKANCQVGGRNWGNLNDWKTINWVDFKKPVVCNQLSCTCGADVPISKWKNNS